MARVGLILIAKRQKDYGLKFIALNVHQLVIEKFAWIWILAS
jgi:hypothetical protein